MADIMDTMAQKEKPPLTLPRMGSRAFCIYKLKCTIYFYYTFLAKKTVIVLR
jgi:hypothetical protein